MSGRRPDPSPRRPAVRLGRAALLALSAALAAGGCQAGGHGEALRPHAPRPGQGPVARLAAARLTPVPHWQLDRIATGGQIAGFADDVSVLPGQRVRLFVSTTASTFDVQALRMGDYRGTQAARIAAWARLPGVRQPGPSLLPRTRTPYADWQPSLSLATAGWPPGDYLFRLQASSGWQTYVPLTVRSPSARGRVLIVNAVTTWQAYNSWGGRSLYTGPRGLASRAYAVSFDRPYAYGGGAGDFLGNELPLVSFAERLGLPLAYATSVDLDRDPRLLTGARAIVSPGHDEYWSQRMRDAVAAARDRGTNVAFLGANADFRPVRFAASALGPDRLEVDYKDYALDPVHRTEPRTATGWAWQSPPFPRPEAPLTGTTYECNPVRADLVVADPGSWLLRGIARPGQRLKDLVGSEYDRVDLSEPTPRPIDVLFHSPVRCRGHADWADAAYYTAPGGAGVFDAGTSSWECALEVSTCPAGRGDAAAQGVIRAVTARLLRAFAAGPAGRAHPAVDDLARLHVRTPAAPRPVPVD